MEKVKEPKRKGKRIQRELLHKLCQYGLSVGAGFIMGGSTVGGHALPLGACLVGAQPLGGCALGTAAGAVAGYFFRCDPADGVEHSALTVLMLLTLLLFQGTALTARRWFMPLCCGTVCIVLGAVRMIGSAEVTLPLWMARGMIAAFGVGIFRRALGGDRRSRVFLGGALILGLAGVGRYLNLGLMGAVAIACVSRELFPATVMGLALDLSGKLPGYMTIAMVLPGVFCKFLRIRKRETVSLAFAILPCVVMLLAGEGQAPQYIGILAGGIGGYVLSRSPLLPPAVTTSEDHTGADRLERAAMVLDVLGKEVPSAEIPCNREMEKVFDAAAEQVCLKCAFFHRCWQNRARETYGVLAAAAPGIMERGVARETDFVKEFRDRCCSIERLLYVINREMEGMLYRRRYYMHLRENRKIMKQEYDLLAHFFRMPEKTERGERRYTPRVSICSVGKNREKTCGDRGACFLGRDDHYYVILCDGMGTGEEAADLSDHTVRLLEKLLQGGMEPEGALRLLNGNMILRGCGTFATVDLLQLDLHSGIGNIYKWGASPSYWREGNRISVVGKATPPPGIGVEDLSVPERFKVSMRNNQLLVMISDGAYGEETESTIAAYSGASTKELAALLIAAMQPEDDMTAIVVSLELRMP